QASCMNSRSGTSFPYGPNVMSMGNSPSEFGRYTFARRIAPSRMGTSAFCSTSILCRPVMAQNLPFRILRPPLWLLTGFINQFFQNIEAVARRIGIVPLAWDFHIEAKIYWRTVDHRDHSAVQFVHCAGGRTLVAVDRARAVRLAFSRA